MYLYRVFISVKKMPCEVGIVGLAHMRLSMTETRHEGCYPSRIRKCTKEVVVHFMHTSVIRSLVCDYADVHINTHSQPLTHTHTQLMRSHKIEKLISPLHPCKQNIFGGRQPAPNKKITKSSER